jgi:hypothetical protein
VSDKTKWKKRERRRERKNQYRSENVTFRLLKISQASRFDVDSWAALRRSNLCIPRNWITSVKEKSFPHNLMEISCKQLWRIQSGEGDDETFKTIKLNRVNPLWNNPSSSHPFPLLTRPVCSRFASVVFNDYDAQIQGE